MRIHMLGIGGTGMGSLAGLLLEAGHEVTGTDEKLYPPMSDVVTSLGIKPFEGYNALNISKINPEMVVIGNVIRRENPEAQEVMRLGIPYKSMPQTLSDLFLVRKTSLVIAGTHGKTSASTLTSWLLKSCGEDPGFLIGGVGLNFGKSYSIGQGQFFVVEGDEYDTAFFDKGPKFLHYKPNAILLTSIEFDHADIYKNLEGIMESFKRLVEILPPDGLLVANSDDTNVMTIAGKANCRVVTYGVESGSYCPSNIKISGSGTTFKLPDIDDEFTLPMWGTHNLSNATGVIAMLCESGLDTKNLSEGILKFKGVKRRQEIVGEVKGIVVVDDFAHHPTAVAKTIESMKLRFPGRRIWAIFEARSNTSRRNIFQNEFAKSLSLADRVIISDPYRVESIPEKERFDPGAVTGIIMHRGVDAHHISDTEHIIEFIVRGINSDDVVLIMSNGNFNDLPVKLTEALKRRKHHLKVSE